MDNEQTPELEAEAPAPVQIYKAQTPRWLLISILAALLAVLAALVVLIVKPDFSGPKAFADMSEQERAAFAGQIKDDVAKHMLMPEEVPQITLADDNYAELVAQGGFWKNLEKGDYILVFSLEPRVVVWRPSEKLIVNVGPIIDDTSEEDGGAPAQE